MVLAKNFTLPIVKKPERIMNQTDILQHQTRQLKQFVPASYCDGLMTGEWSA